MSDAPAPKVKKKKGKLPIIIALVAVVAGGGYFGLSKGKTKTKPKVEAPKCGGVLDLGEFTVNLKNGTSYLRAKVAIQLDSKSDATHMKEVAPALQDVVVEVLSNKIMSDVLTQEGKQQLRYELAFELNDRMHMLHPPEPKKPGEKKEEAHGMPTEHKFPQYDSDTGPVLKVYLTDFAMQ
jgi:flagellar basal body-associated protein FliL